MCACFGLDEGGFVVLKYVRVIGAFSICARPRSARSDLAVCIWCVSGGEERRSIEESSSLQYS